MNNLTHIECIFDFCGNSTHPGIWADKHGDDSGKEFISFGGDWISYTDKFKSIKKEFGDRYIEEILSGKQTKNWLDEELQNAWDRLDYPHFFPMEGMESIVRDLECGCYGSAVKLINDAIV